MQIKIHDRTGFVRAMLKTLGFNAENRFQTIQMEPMK